MLLKLNIDTLSSRGSGLNVVRVHGYESLSGLARFVEPARDVPVRRKTRSPPAY